MAPQHTSRGENPINAVIYTEGWPENIHTIYPGRDNSWVTAGATRGLHGSIHTSRGENLINAVIYTEGWLGKARKNTSHNHRIQDPNPGKLTTRWL
ncbi:MAG TPA: hypothetical protein VKM36_09620 [Balneolaceae bacterium]|nr:hypothetical protein [Balneolaceae bacterium]